MSRRSYPNWNAIKCGSAQSIQRSITVPVGCVDTNSADGCCCPGYCKLAIYSISQTSVQVERINSTEKMALPPLPTYCRGHNAELINHEYILRLSLSDLSVPCVQSLWEVTYLGLIILLILCYSFFFINFFSHTSSLYGIICSLWPLYLIKHSPQKQLKKHV